MPAPERRPLRVLDIMILVAATAAGFIPFRIIVGPVGLRELRPARIVEALRDSGDLETVGYTLFELYGVFLIPWLMTWTPALCLISIIPPGVSSRRRAGNPGVVACRSASLILLLWLPGIVLRKALGGGWSRMGGVYVGLFGIHSLVLIPCVGCGVAASLLTLALSRRWKSGRDWIDRASQVVGLLWLVSVPFGIFLISTGL